MPNKKTIILLLICLWGSIAFSQTQIIGGAKTPRLTPSQIAQIDTANAEGLLVYNLETDCLNYYNGMEWVELCLGTSVPSVEFPVGGCNRSRVYGQYYEHLPLDNTTNYITFLLMVTQKGNYNIVAQSNNGYYFQSSGVFETTGLIELRLEGIGAPINAGTDTLDFSCNGVIITPATCPVQITVNPLTISYHTNCEGIKIFGNYYTRTLITSDNYIKLPIDVLETGIAPDNMVNIETDDVNGIRFSITDYELTTLGVDTLILHANGQPLKAGNFRFTFVTNGAIKTICSFVVNCIPNLGTFNNPACKCLDIYNEYPTAANGEYWLQDCNAGGAKVKTFCDIANGGWTLLWSYSEKTARDIYVQNSSSGGTGNTNTMIVSGDYWGFTQDRGTNRLTTEADSNTKINYANFRLNRAEWQHFPTSIHTPQIKVHITDNPTNVNDEWGLNNYAIISPRNINENPIESIFESKGYVPTVGKLFGKKWGVKTNGGGAFGGWTEFDSSPDNFTLSSGTYCAHWNLYRYGGNTEFDVIPNKNKISGKSNKMSFSYIDSVFGWFGRQPTNHHFGKVSIGIDANDDYSFATKYATSAAHLVPHSFNNGEGRYLQWFVK